MPAWSPGTWAGDAWAGTAWDETAPGFGQAWFANAWAAGAWGTAAWASGGTPEPGPEFDLAAPAIVPLSGALGIAGSFSIVTPGLATITIRLLDAAVAGAALPSLTGIQWAWWDDAADESETWGVTPTASGTTEVSDAAGAIDLVATGSTKTSGQTAFIKLYKHGYPPRAFSGLLTVD